MTTTDNLIRSVGGVELPTPGWWQMHAHQPVTLRRRSWRSRASGGTAAGGLTIAGDPYESTLDLLVSPAGAGIDAGADDDLLITASLVSASPGGWWRFAGTVSGTVTRPVAVDVRYHGVFRRGDRASAWLTVWAALPRAAGGRRVTLTADLHAESPASRA